MAPTSRESLSLESEHSPRDGKHKLSERPPGGPFPGRHHKGGEMLTDKLVRAFLMDPGPYESKSSSSICDFKVKSPGLVTSWVNAT